MEFAADCGDVKLSWWQLEAHLVHGVGNDPRYGKAAKPFLVRGNDVPGRALGTCQRNGVFIGLHIFRPKLAFGVVAFADLPTPRRIVQAWL